MQSIFSTKICDVSSGKGYHSDFPDEETYSEKIKWLVFDESASLNQDQLTPKCRVLFTLSYKTTFSFEMLILGVQDNFYA